MVMTNLVLTRKGATTAALPAILAVIPRAKLGPQKYGRGHQPPTRKGARAVITGKEEDAEKAVTKVNKEIQTSESKRKISPRFPATTGHAATDSASTLTHAAIVTMGRKEIKTKQQGQRQPNHPCL